MHVRQIDSALREIIGTLKSKNASSDSGVIRSTLLTYGDDHNLAPAQLEKLAQTLNVSLALAHAKQASPNQRGDQFDIVDVPALLERYEDPGRRGTKSAAAIKHRPPEWESFSVGRHFHEGPATVDWNKIDRHFANKHFDENVSETGGWQQQKAASGAAHAELQDSASYERLADEAWKEIKQALRRSAEIIGKNPRAYTEIVQDVEHILGEKAATTLDMLDKHLAHLHYPFPKMAATDTRDFVTDRHGIAEDMLKVADAVEQRWVCLEMAKEAVAGAKTKQKTDKDKKNGGGDTPEPFVPGRPSPGTYDDSAGSPPPAAAASPKTDPDIAGALFGPVNAAGHAAQELGAIGSQVGSQDSARSMADNYGILFGAHREQAGQRLESNLQKWQHAAVLQRLMMSDDVLRRADPSQVVAAFDTIRRNNPTLARDINVARILMREAVQYQGVPIQSVETLQKLNRPAPSEPKPR